MSAPGLARRYRVSEPQPLLEIRGSLEAIANQIAEHIDETYHCRDFHRARIRPERGCAVFVDPELHVFVLPDAHELTDLWLSIHRSWWLGTYPQGAYHVIVEDLRDLIG